MLVEISGCGIGWINIYELILYSITCSYAIFSDDERLLSIILCILLLKSDPFCDIKLILCVSVLTYLHDVRNMFGMMFA